MKELEIFTPDSFDEAKRSNMMIMVCDQQTIHCATFRKLQETVDKSGLKAVLVMPEEQFVKGTRGWAKAHILASVTGRIQGVMPLSYDAAKEELGRNWAAKFIDSQARWGKADEVARSLGNGKEPRIVETQNPFDRQMLRRARDIVANSNCWLDPAGSVIVKGEEVLVEAVSTNFNHSKCREIPIDFKELQLNPGERMLFCDSLHSERVAISQAARAGIYLNGSTIYVTKFPCRSCSQDIIAAGITTVVFGNDSYGLRETADLFADGKILLKRVT